MTEPVENGFELGLGLEHERDPADVLIEAEQEALADGFRPTDVGNSLRLLAIADGEIRYVRAWNKCIIHRDGAWIVDNGNVLGTGLSERVCRGMFEFAIQSGVGADARDAMLRWAKDSESGARLREMINLVRNKPGILVEHTELDQQHELLNVPNGTIDMLKGVLLPHDPDHLLTKQLNTIYNPLDRAPVFLEFLSQVQPDPEMRAYLQEIIGAAATGYTPEEFYIHFGGGGNGKGKFFNVITWVLGPYAIEPHRSLFINEKHEQHETIVAELFGARLGVMAETKGGARLNTDKINELTGNDHPLSGRRMKEDRWSFWSTHSLMMHTNHKPIILDSSDGIWRRIRLIPWDVTIPLKDQDPTLSDRLRAEAPGVLNWIVEGAHRWLNNGRKFTMPTQVVEASAKYRGETDPLFRCLSMATMNGSTSFATARELHELFMAWRSQVEWHDETPQYVSKQTLGTYLKTRFTPKKVDNIRGWRGIAIKPEWKEWLDQVRVMNPSRLKSLPSDTD